MAKYSLGCGRPGGCGRPRSPKFLDIQEPLGGRELVTELGTLRLTTIMSPGPDEWELWLSSLAVLLSLVVVGRAGGPSAGDVNGATQ